LETAKNEVRAQINRNEVTTFPIFPECVATESKTLADQKACFFDQTSAYIYAFLENEELNAVEAIEDTIYLNINVSDKGKFSLVGIPNLELLSDDLQSLKLICNEAVESIPKIDPARKHEVDVAIHFNIPLILSSTKNE
jgi:L-cysteine desulfidase